MPIINEEKDSIGQIDNPLSNLIVCMKDAIMEYVAMIENKTPKSILEFDLDYIQHSHLTVSRKADIQQIHEMWTFAENENQKAYDLAEVIHLYFQNKMQTGLSLWGYTLVQGNSRLREKVNDVIYAFFPLLMLEEDERELMKKLSQPNPQAVADAQLKNLLATAHQQTEELQHALTQANQNNVTLVNKLKKSVAESKSLKSALRESEQAQHCTQDALKKEKSISLALRKTIQQKTNQIHFLTELIDQQTPSTVKPAPRTVLQASQKHFTHFKSPGS